MGVHYGMVVQVVSADKYVDRIYQKDSLQEVDYSALDLLRQVAILQNDPIDEGYCICMCSIVTKD